MNAIEDVVFRKTKNFRETWKIRKTSWRPLNEEYRKWKKRKGFSQEIWIMRGETMKALSTAIRLGPTGATFANRTVRITVNTPLRVEATWTINKPAAGGYFKWANARRTWLGDKASWTAATRAECQRRIEEIVRAAFRREFSKV
jgi:hypothetical protein